VVLIGYNLTGGKSWEEFSSITLHKGLIWPREDIGAQLPAVALGVELCRRFPPELGTMKDLDVWFTIWNAAGGSFASRRPLCWAPALTVEEPRCAAAGYLSEASGVLVKTSDEPQQLGPTFHYVLQVW